MEVINAQGVVDLAFNQTEYIDEWNRKNIDRVTIKIPKGKKNVLKTLADKHNTSVNQLVINAVEEQYNVDLTTK